MRQLKKGEVAAVGGGPLERVPVRMPDGTLKPLSGSLSGYVETPILTRYRGRVCTKVNGKEVCVAVRRIIRPGTIKRMETPLPASVEDETIPEGTVVEVQPSATITARG